MTEDATDLLGKDGKPVVKGRIRPALDTAIRLIEEQGFTIADAAKSVGYRTHSLVQALHKPHVRAFRAHVKRAWRESESSYAWYTMTRLARDAASEDVKFKSAKFLIEMDEAANNRMPEQARQLVQIVTNTVQIGQQPTEGQLSGVIEAAPFQLVKQQPSDSQPVRRPVIEADDAE